MNAVTEDINEIPMPYNVNNGNWCMSEKSSCHWTIYQLKRGKWQWVKELNEHDACDWLGDKDWLNEAGEQSPNNHTKQYTYWRKSKSFRG